MANSDGGWRFISGTTLALALAASMTVTGTMRAQGAQGDGAQRQRRPQVPRSSASSDTDTRQYDKHDFGGIWTHFPGDFGLPPCPECNEQNSTPIPGYGYFGDVPPRTPAGEAKLLMTHHGRGYEPDDPRLKQYPNLDPAYKRAGLPAYSNDPEARCDMMGLARSIVMSGPNSNMEMVHSRDNDRIIQTFEWYDDHRNIWLDGRPLPKPGAYIGNVNGYSVGKWEGDTLVVTSTGFDDRQWVDMFGFPISEDAILTERWERPSPNRLRATLTLTDPVNYTRPWTSTVKTWMLVPNDVLTKRLGWAGIFAEKRIPSDEAEFNTFRDKAAGKK